MIKKLLLCLISLTLFTCALWADGKQPAKKERSVVPPLEELIELKESQEILHPEPLDGRQIDTLIYDDGSPVSYFQWGNGARMAQRMTPAGPCKILTLQYYCYATGTATFDAAIYDWTGSMPGAQLGTLVPVPMDATHQWRNADFSSQDINVTGDFIASFNLNSNNEWLGFDWLDIGRPWDYNYTYWEIWAGTYFIRAIVEYGGGDPDIECNPNPLVVDMGTGGRDTTVIFYCKNVGAGLLDVTNIVRSAAWIDSIYPTTFNVLPGDSDTVYVVIDTSQVQRDTTFEDTIWITSNDPDENPYGEVVILIVPGVEEETEVSETPATPSVKCYPNPARNSTSIRFALPHTEEISIDIYDVSGKRVSNILNGEYESGVHNIAWNRKDEKGMRVPQGIYFIRLKSEGIKKQGKIILVD